MSVRHGFYGLAADRQEYSFAKDLFIIYFILFYFNFFIKFIFEPQQFCLQIRIKLKIYGNELPLAFQNF